MKQVFFAKELIQDLVDTPIFAGGRSNVADHGSYCPVGPGSINGLKVVFRRESIYPSETLPMIQALHSFAGDFFEGSAQELDLHDIQFQLCEFQKLVGEFNDSIFFGHVPPPKNGMSPTPNAFH